MAWNSPANSGRPTTTVRKGEFKLWLSGACPYRKKLTGRLRPSVGRARTGDGLELPCEPRKANMPSLFWITLLHQRKKSETKEGRNLSDFQELV